MHSTENISSRHDHSSATSDVITVVRDPRNPLGKRFVIDADGAVTKTAAVTVTHGAAVMHHVPDAAALAALLREVSDDAHAAIVPDGFRGVAIGERFVMLSERELEQRLGVKGRAAVIGVHELEIDGQMVKAVGRLKENVAPGSWALLDRDIDAHTPERFASMAQGQWLAAVDAILPGVSAAEMVRVGSSSARVLRDGVSVGSGSGHVWVRVADPSDRRRVQVAMMVRAAERGMTWLKPKQDRKTGAVIGQSLTTVLDTSVWTPGRLVFVGRPIALAPLRVVGAQIEVIGGLFGDDPLDTAAVAFDAARVSAITRAAGVEMQLSRATDGGLKIDAQDLALETLLELEDGRTITVAKAVAAGKRLRCQTPFRASVSVAAFFDVAPGGRPFVHDVGTGITHWCELDATDDFDSVTNEVDDAEQIAVRERNTARQPDRVTNAAVVIEQVRALLPSEVPMRWAALALGLSKSGAQLVVDEVSRLTGLGKRPLAGDLADARRRETVKAVGALTATHAAGRLIVPNEVDAFTKSAALVEAEVARRSAPGNFISFGGALARVTTRTLPFSHRIDDEEAEAPPVWQIEPLDQAAILGAVERWCMFTEPTTLGPVTVAVPQRVLDVLRTGKDRVAPTVNGLLVHPIVLPDGTILASDGLDARTGLFMVNAELDGCRSYDQSEAVEALERVRKHLCAGFEFATQLDAELAVAALFTAAQRRVLDQAPGLCVVAAVQASGKTTLPRRIHLILTGQDLPVQTMAGDETELQKRLLATLQRSPAMLVLDNVGDGLTFRSPTLAAIMTSPVWSSRVLGATQEVDVPTNATICVTGNNLQLGADELTRFLVCRLAPAAARPEERQFEHADIVQHALSVRTEVLRDVLGIVSGCVQAGGVQASRGVRFKRWDKLVRQPLIWAGALDPAAAFAANSATSEEHLALGGLLGTLREVFGADEFGSGDVASLVRGDAGFSSRAAVKTAALRVDPDGLEELAGRLRSQLEALRTKDVSGERSVGHAMAARVGRVVSLEIDGATHSARLMSRPDKNLGVKLYSVEVLA
jgi:hypothetical protein